MAAENTNKPAADWAARGFSCDLWTDPPGQRWENFTHATDELVTVLEGDMEFEVAGTVHHPRPGEELLIPAGTVHSARNVVGTHRADVEKRFKARQIRYSDMVNERDGVIGLSARLPQGSFLGFYSEIRLEMDSDENNRPKDRIVYRFVPSL